MILVLFGPPGSGKGTQSEYLLQTGKFIHISTGELLRAEVKRATPLGMRVANIMEKGELVHDEILMALIKNCLSEISTKHIIFDGFPRTLNQAEAFTCMLDDKDLKVDLVVDFKIDLDQLIDRISGRFSCSDCGFVYHDIYHKLSVEGICDKCHGTKFVRRIDDQSEVVKNRIQQYLSSTEVVKQYYMQKGIMVSVDASNDPETVKLSLKNCLSQAGFDI